MQCREKELNQGKRRSVDGKAESYNSFLANGRRDSLIPQTDLAAVR